MPSRSARPQQGFTTFAKPTGANTPSGIMLEDGNGQQWVLWVDTAGKLRISEPAVTEVPGFNWLTGGTAIGTQT
jgi:hypothetical protein